MMERRMVAYKKMGYQKSAWNQGFQIFLEQEPSLSFPRESYKSSASKK